MTFYDFLIRHFKKNVKSHVFLKSEKKRKICIIEHWVTVFGKLFHTHCASVYRAAKLIAALLRVAGVTAGLAERNGS